MIKMFFLLRKLCVRKHTWFVFFFFLQILIGCAANHNKTSPPPQPVDKPAGMEQSVKEDALIVESSQGTQSIEPTVVTYPPETFKDPLEFVNRPIFIFNDYSYRYALIPISKGYLKIMPQVVLTSINNVFDNIREPLNAANHLFQLHGKSAGASLGRFFVNTTVGLLGLFDPADSWLEIKEQKTDLNDTLSFYGLGYGFYLVVPILGPTDARDGASRVIEGFASPIVLLTDYPETLYIQGFEQFNQFAPSAEGYEKLRNESDDPYLFFRNLYLQGVLRDEQYKQE